MPKFIENDEIEIGIKATKEFTDREEPRKVFWDKYNMMASEMNVMEAKKSFSKKYENIQMLS